ncbi:MAG: hypothetical protein ACE15D_09690 [Candidatus Eisenbacteria bacterium]
MHWERADRDAIAVGISAVTAQTVLIREILARGAGNELSLTLHLALWLAGSALGARFWAARSRRDGGRTFQAGIGPLVSAGLLLAAAGVVFIRFLAMPGVGAGEEPSVAGIFLLGAAALLPAGWFTAGSFGGIAGPAGRAYAGEAIGAAIGGTAVTALVIAGAAPLAMLAGAGAVVLALAGPGRAARAAALLLALAAVAGPAARLDATLFRLAWESRHPGLDLLEWRRTPSRTLALAGREGERWLLADERPRAVLGDPAREEAVAALVVAAGAEAPRNVLAVDAGSAPLASAMASAGIRRFVAVLPDRAEAELAGLSADSRAPNGQRRPDGQHRPDGQPLPNGQRLPDGQPLPNGQRLPDGQPLPVAPLPPSSLVLAGDPRAVLRHQAASRGGWDRIVMIGGEAASIAGNRIWTREAFRDAAGALGPSGVLVAIAPGGEAARGPEAEAWRRSIFTSLAKAFGESANVTAIDADRFVLVASKAASPPASLRGDSLAARLRRSHAALATYPPERFLVEFPADRLLQRPASLARAPANTDLRPAAFASAIDRWLRRAGLDFRIGGGFALALSLAVVLAAGLAPTLTRRRPAALLPVGAAAMALDLMVLMLYQARVGILAAGLGALLGLFLGGTALGAALAAWKPVRRPGAALLLALGAPAGASALALPLLLAVPAGPPALATVAFGGVALLFGASCGLAFPLLCEGEGAAAWAYDSAGGIAGAFLVLVLASRGLAAVAVALISMLALALALSLAAARGTSASAGAGPAPTSTRPGSLGRSRGSGRPEGESRGSCTTSGARE